MKRDRTTGASKGTYKACLGSAVFAATQAAGNISSRHVDFNTGVPEHFTTDTGTRRSKLAGEGGRGRSKEDEAHRGRES